MTISFLDLPQEQQASISIKLEKAQRLTNSSSPSTSDDCHQVQMHPPLQDKAQINRFEPFSDSANDCESVECNGDKKRDTREVMGKYKMSLTKKGLLGEGSFSICRRGTDSVTGEAVAIKVYKPRRGSIGNAPGKVCSVLKKFLRQVAVLKELQEDFVIPEAPELWHETLAWQKPCKSFVRLLDYSKSFDGEPGPDPSDGLLYVVTELGQCSLKDLLRRQRAQGELLPRRKVRQLVRSILLASAALHAKGYVHLDLKPENMMFFGSRLKIIDVDGCMKIGSVASMWQTSTSYSPYYCAPEWARFLQEGAQSEIIVQPTLDSWSVGLTLCECISLSAVMRPAFAHFAQSASTAKEAQTAFIHWLSCLETSPVPSIIEKFDADLSELVSEALLACDPDLRRTPAECLSTPFLSQTQCSI